jgi:negative regulator of genetic competence, sporulation and motility
MYEGANGLPQATTTTAAKKRSSSSASSQTNFEKTKTEGETRSESEEEEYLLYFCISWRQFQLISFHMYFKTVIGSIHGINLGDN